MSMPRYPFFLKVIFSLYALVLTSPVHAYTPETEASIPSEITSIFQRHKIPLDSISIYIMDLDSGRPLLLFNENTPRNPASTIKLLTTMAALDILGPSYFWETEFAIDGNIEDERLNGNLVLRGGGDPFISKDEIWNILFNLQARGIRHIDGDLVIDDSLFEDETGSPADFDNKPYHVYNIFPDAALLNFNAHEFIIVPEMNTVRVYIDPPSDNLKIDNRLKLVKGGCYSSKNTMIMHVFNQGSNTMVRFSGNYPAACGEKTIIRSVMKHDEYIFGIFKSMWLQLGGTISGSYRNESPVLTGEPIYTFRSMPLTEIIKDINKHSNNVMSRQLLLTIGHETNGKPGNKKAGIVAIRDWLESIDIHAPELLIDNGSGLSRKSRITASHLGSLLEYAYKSPLHAEFLSSLPLHGGNGTMRKRLNGDFETGSVRIKTGLLDHVRTMAGFIRSKNKNNYAIVVLQNHTNIHRQIGTAIQDQIIDWVYQQ
jgi:D-alanyl-D-alanine carboxypeptidase/D-alanyl-D-alanine-endopeptidase (penicillin-binding protein 4)